MDILSGGMMESVEKLGMDGKAFYFQQDNDPNYTSEKAHQFFQDKYIQHLDWYSQYFNLNPIKYLWFHLKERLRKCERDPKELYELWERLEVEWNGIGAQTCKNLI